MASLVTTPFQGLFGESGWWEARPCDLMWQNWRQCFVSIPVQPTFTFSIQLFNCDTQHLWAFFCASICYLESDTGSVLDLKWHFLPFQGDLSGVERSCGEWKRRTGGWMNGVDDGVSLEQRTESTFPLPRMRDKRVETHRCLLHSPRWTSWSETWRSELKRERDISAWIQKKPGQNLR